MPSDLEQEPDPPLPAALLGRSPAPRDDATAGVVHPRGPEGRGLVIDEVAKEKQEKRTQHCMYW